MFHNVRVLLWKNLLIRKHHIIAAVAEVLVPILVTLLINIYLPKLNKDVDKGEINFAAFEAGKCGSGHSYEDIVVFEPNTSFTNELMTLAACYAGYKSKGVKPGILSDNNTMYSIGVKFEKLVNQSVNISTASNSLTYTLYPTHSAWLQMHVTWRHLETLVPRYNVPIIHDLIELQRAIDASYLHMNKITALKVELQNTDLFDKGPKILTFITAIIFFFVCTLIIPNVIARIVDEKYSGAKELMIMMGVTRLQLWIAKFIEAYFSAFLSITGVIIFLYVPLKDDSNVLHVSPMLFWFVCMYGIIGLILYLFFLSCFFVKASFAVFIAEIIATFLLINYNFISTAFVLPVLVKYILYFFPQVTLMSAITVLLDFDYYEKEVKLTEKLSAREDYSSLLEILIFMTINILLFLILTWYAEQVVPGKYGVPQSYGFCLKKEYWFSKKVKSKSTENGISLNNLNQESFEFVPSDLKPGITLTNVSKIYKTHNKEPVIAVNNVSLNFYFTEITSLLGHNGAGKTTVFSLITGLTYPSSGKVFINGYDLSRNIKQARRDLGMCPQQDMLFHELTAIQNLIFFGMIKGMKLNEVSYEAKKLVELLNLEGVENTKSSKLSGGQKRKVSLGIALIGGSKILVLDEPSSGLDPEIRREIWEILLKLKGDRTILLTTHFMEEAEALSDRIAIMDEGKVKCFGSSLFLKSKYGQGYILSIVLKEIDNLQRLTDFIKEFTPGAKFKSQNIRTVKYEIPLDEMNKFPKLLIGLDRAHRNSEIVSYNISFATLEDVFFRLRLKSSDEEIVDTVDANYKKLNEELFESVEKNIPTYFLPIYQFWALLIKKYVNLIRTIFTFLIYCLLPISLLLFFDILENRIRSAPGEVRKLDKSRPISYFLNLYSPFTILYSVSDNNIGNAFANFVNNLNFTAEKVNDIKEEILTIFRSDFHQYSKNINLGFDFSSDQAEVYYNEDAVHIIPIALNLLHNFGFKVNNLNNVIVTALDTKYIREEFHLPKHNIQCKFNKISEFTTLQVFYYLLGPIREYSSGSKHIQLMMTSAFLYWLSHLLFDTFSFVLYLIPICIYFNYIDETTLMITYAEEIYLSIFLWGVGLIIVTYVVAKIIRHEAGALVVMVILYIFFSFVVNNKFIGAHLPEFFPYLHPNSLIELFLKSVCDGRPNKKLLLGLFIYDVTLFFTLILMESNFWIEIWHRCMSFCAHVDYEDEENEEDELVFKEKQEVQNIIDKNKISEYPLVVKDLKRWYLVSLKAKPVVRGISFHVTEGECFGLLGVNGAGKTTTFKILTADIPPSSGKLYLDSKKLNSFWKKENLFQVSYCPQHNGLISLFNGRELLMFIGRLRGLYGQKLKNEVESLLQKLDLVNLAYQSCGTYSGGNQRKLSTAMAIIGHTRLIFLDEPTTGVDPVSRRLTWNLIDKIQKKGRSFILTSHSMDECEALCSRLAIMVNGNFRCIGELVTLKERFGEGYVVQLKIAVGASVTSINAIKTTMFNNFQPGVLLMDDHKTLLQYKITNPNVSWAELFDTLNTLKNTYEDIESYGASSTTLEQIFISFARQQK